MIECFIIELHAKVEDAHRRFTDTQRRSSTPKRTKQPRPRPTGIGDEAGAGQEGAEERLLLDAAGGQAGDNVLLQVLEQQDHRDGRDHGAGREDTPRGGLRVGRPRVHADG